MKIEEFKQLSQADAFKEAGRIAGVQPSVFDGIWATESARGQHMLSRAGAEGHFQLMPKTRATLEQRFGHKIDPHNFHEALFASAELMRENVARFGNVGDALRAYNNGWDRSRWNNPETTAYADRVFKFAGLSQEAALDKSGPAYAPAATAKKAAPLTAEATWGQGAPLVAPAVQRAAPVLNNAEQFVRQAAYNAGGSAAADVVENRPLESTMAYGEAATRPPEGSDVKGVDDVAAANAQANDKRLAAETDVAGWGTSSMLSTAVQAMPLNSFMLERTFRPRFQDTPGFIADRATLDAARSDEERDAYLRAGSMDEIQVIRGEFTLREEQQQQIASRGTGMGFAVQAAAGLMDPTSLVIGGGIAKVSALSNIARVSSFAQSGRAAGAAVGAAEGAAGNVAFSLMEQASQDHYSMADTALAAIFGAVPGAAVGAWTHGATAYATKPEVADAVLIERIRQHAEDYNAGLLREAEKAAGPGATPEAVQAKMQEIEAERIRQRGDAIAGELPDSKKLMTTVIDDAEDVPAPSGDIVVEDVDGFEIPAGAFDERVSDLDARIKQAEELAPPVQWWRSDVAISTENGITGSRMLNHWVAEVTDGQFDNRSIALASPGVHFTREIMDDVRLAGFRSALKSVVEEYMGPQVKFIVGHKTSGPSARGEHLTWGSRAHVIGIDTSGNFAVDDMARTALHEIGHGVWERWAREADPALINRIREVWADSVLDVQKAKFDYATHLTSGRYSATSRQVASAAELNQYGVTKSIQDQRYQSSLAEFMAEQFVAHLEKRALAGDKLLNPGVMRTLKKMLEDLWRLFNTDLAKLTVRAAPDEFFTSVLEGKWGKTTSLQRLTALKNEAVAAKKAAENYISQSRAPEPGQAALTSAPPATAAPAKVPVTKSATALKFGLDTLPADTPRKRAEVKAMEELLRKADDWAATNPIDRTRLKALTGKLGLGSTSLTLLSSKNPLVQFIASRLVENPAGAAGRDITAAVTRHMLERRFVGATASQYETLYSVYRRANKGSHAEDLLHGNTRARFDKEVAEVIERRRRGEQWGSDTANKAADLLEGAYDRMRAAQIAARTPGHGALPESSRGYMPHRMSPQRIRDLTVAQTRAIHAALVKQFVGLKMDEPFARTLASKYLERVRQNAVGGFHADVNVHSSGAQSMLSDLIDSSNFTAAERKALGEKLRASAAGHTKKRLDIDLLEEHANEDGSTFRLLDVFETDQSRLLRSQAERVSGDVSLSRFGLPGKAGLDLARRAMVMGDNPATVKELEAFDQVAAEFLGTPFGTRQQWAERATQLTSLVRLGGMGWTQAAEYSNGIVAVGVRRTLSALAGFSRLRSEAARLARGEDVGDSFLRDIEKFSGASFGTDAYNMRMPFDDPNAVHQLYGRDTLAFGDKLLRGGVHAQGVLSFWRSIHAAQQRGFAEQIAAKAIDFVRSGKNDTALRDMGFTDDMMTVLRRDIDSVATFKNGRLDRLDLSKTDVDVAERFVQAVHRGTNQIIQGTFIGETGAWAHSSQLKLLTQFRTFGIVSIEKQWGRNKANYGVLGAMGILMGSMSVAAPVYMARVSVAAAGRPDRDEYLEKMLDPMMIAKATLNYVSSAGLSGDLIDALSVVAGRESPLAGRGNQATNFFGSTVAPAAGVVEDVWKGIQNTKDGTDPSQLLGALPLSKLPLLVPAFNLLKD